MIAWKILKDGLPKVFLYAYGFMSNVAVEEIKCAAIVEYGN